MKETEILRGLGKAKVNKFAGGFVPPRMEASPGYKDLVRAGYDQTARTAAPTPRAAPAVPAAQLVSPVVAPAALGAAMMAYPSPIAEEWPGGGKTAGWKPFVDGAKNFSRGVAQLDGPGTSTSDSIPAMLSKGEAVLPAATVQAVGPQNIARLIEETNGAAPKRGLRTGDGYALGYVKDKLSGAAATVKDWASGVGGSTASAAELPGENAARLRGGVNPVYMKDPATGVIGGGGRVVPPATPTAPIENPNAVGKAFNKYNGAAMSGIGRWAGGATGALTALDATSRLKEHGVDLSNEKARAADDVSDLVGGAAAVGGALAGGAYAAPGAALLTGKTLGGLAVQGVDKLAEMATGKSLSDRYVETQSGTGLGAEGLKYAKTMPADWKPVAPVTAQPKLNGPESGSIAPSPEAAASLKGNAPAPAATPAAEQPLVGLRSDRMKELVDMALRGPQDHYVREGPNRGQYISGSDRRGMQAAAGALLDRLIQSDTTLAGHEMTLRAAQAKAAPTAMDLAKNAREEDANTRAAQEASQKELAGALRRPGDTDDMVKERTAEFSRRAQATIKALADTDNAFRNPQTGGKARSWEELDQADRTKLLQLDANRQRFSEAGDGVLNTLLGNHHVNSDNLLDYQMYEDDAGNIRANSGSVMAPSDIAYEEGAANPWWFDSGKTADKSFRSRVLRKGS